MITCPTCGSRNIHRSPSRSMMERFQKRFTSERIHRCHDCNWRGWGLETSVHTERRWAVTHQPPDFAAIDAALARHEVHEIEELPAPGSDVADVADVAIDPSSDFARAFAEENEANR
jgi:hypothetical protein